MNSGPLFCPVHAITNSEDAAKSECEKMAGVTASRLAESFRWESRHTSLSALQLVFHNAPLRTSPIPRLGKDCMATFQKIESS